MTNDKAPELQTIVTFIYTYTFFASELTHVTRNIFYTNTNATRILKSTLYSYNNMFVWMCGIVWILHFPPLNAEQQKNTLKQGIIKENRGIINNQGK